MKTATKMMLGTAVVLGLIVGGCFVGTRGAGDDEAPIRVRNGSLEVDQVAQSGAVQQEWAEEASENDLDPDETASRQFRSKPQAFYLSNDRLLHVTLTGDRGTCSTSNTATGRRVIVGFSDGYVASIRRRGLIGFTRTRVGPKDGLTMPSSYLLQHGNAGSGHITNLRVCTYNRSTNRCEDALNCNFQANDKPEVYICHGRNQAQCLK